jgi:peroxiredoxin
MRQLGQLAKDQPEYDKLGVQIFGTCPERPEVLKRTVTKLNLAYQLLSDPEGKLMRAFGVAHRISDDEFAQFKSAGKDLEGDSGFKHHLLPIHAVYLLGTDGKVKYAMPVTDESKHIDFKALMDAAKAAVGK